MKMAKELTSAEYAALPLLNSHDKVFGLKALFVHQSLKGAPVSVVTATGQYRLSTRLSVQAAKAFYAARERGGYDGECDGKLGNIIQKMRGISDSSSICSEPPENLEPVETPKLESLAAKLAREALADLQTLTVNAVEAEFQKSRGTVIAAALSRLGELG